MNNTNANNHKPSGMRSMTNQQQSGQIDQTPSLQEKKPTHCINRTCPKIDADYYMQEFNTQPQPTSVAGQTTDQSGEEKQQTKPSALTPQRKSRRRYPNSKKHVVSQLPIDFRDTMVKLELANYAALPDHFQGDFLLAFLLIAVSGCRPEELAIGETNPTKSLRFGVESGFLKIEIWGAKVKKEEDGTNSRGLTVRTIEINHKFNLASKVLHDYCVINSIVRQPFHFKTDSLRKGFARASKRYHNAVSTPKKQRFRISPVCFRHAVASDLKSSEGVTDLEIAMMLGHLSTKSAARYGRKRRGQRGKVKPFVQLGSRPTPRSNKNPAANPKQKFE